MRKPWSGIPGYLPSVGSPVCERRGFDRNPVGRAAVSTQPLDDLRGIEPGSAEHLEGDIGSPPDRQIRSFETGRSRVQHALSRLGMFGDGFTHGRPV
jgi:hypothetical protein